MIDLVEGDEFGPGREGELADRAVLHHAVEARIVVIEQDAERDPEPEPEQEAREDSDLDREPGPNRNTNLTTTANVTPTPITTPPGLLCVQQLQPRVVNLPMLPDLSDKFAYR